MKGFEITINGDKKVVAVNKGVVILTLSCELGISITGGDDEEGVGLQWDKSTMDVGDKITIIPTETNSTDPSKSKTLRDRKKLLESYFYLKDILTRKGLL